MAWCPKCKREYIDGVTLCKECDISLFPGEAHDYTIVLKDNNEEAILTTFNYLKETTDFEIQLYSDFDSDLYEIYCLNENINDVKDAITLYLKNELINSDEEVAENSESDETAESKQSESKSGTYVSARDKYDERRSSAYSTIFVGAVGMIFMLLQFVGIIDFHFDGGTKILSYTTMTVLFSIFIVIGVVTLFTSRKYKSEITTEEDLIEKLKAFVSEEITAEKIDSQCNFPEDSDQSENSEELKYFDRFSVIKSMINERFPNSDETLVDELVDEYYPLIFK